MEDRVDLDSPGCRHWSVRHRGWAFAGAGGLYLAAGTILFVHALDLAAIGILGIMLRYVRMTYAWVLMRVL